MIALKILFIFVVIVSLTAWKLFKLPTLKEFRLKVLYPTILATTLVQPAHASREVGNIATSGIIFKDSLRINAFDDPKVSGVVLYLSDFDRPITDKLASNFFNDPSSSALTCARTGTMKFKEDIYLGKDGEEVFEEARSLFFKQIRVRRIVDKEKQTIVYVAYNTRLDKSDDSNKSRFKSSLCAIHID